jgi:hypothetical protein
MKSINFLSIALIVIMLLDTCSKSFIVLNFELNKDYYAKVLCVKKNIAGNKCNGHCHLKKELRAEDQRENKAPSSSQVKYEVNYLNTFSEKLSFFIPQLSVLNFYFKVKNEIQFSGSVFRPPCC